MRTRTRLSRITLGGLVSVLVVSSGIGARPSSAQPAVVPGAYGGVSIEAFDRALSPYGEWVMVGRFGRAWRPYATIVGADFQPYVTGGHWSTRTTAGASRAITTGAGRPSTMGVGCRTTITGGFGCLTRFGDPPGSTGVTEAVTSAGHLSRPWDSRLAMVLDARRGASSRPLTSWSATSTTTRFRSSAPIGPIR